MKFRSIIWTILFVVRLLVVVWLWRRGPEEVPAYASERVLQTATLDGVTYVLTDDGNVFRVINERGTWTWVDRVFDPDEIARSFVREGDAVFRVDPESGKRYRLVKEFEDSFEDVPEEADGLRALIGEQRKWTEFTLQSPRTPTVSDYVGLRKRILKEGADFLDASVAPSSSQAHSGRQSLRCVCPAKASHMVCSKASIGTGFVYFEQGEHLWLDGWFRIEGTARPFTLADIEDRQCKESPGIRLMLFNGDELGVELKALEKPKYRQLTDRKIGFPTDRWVHVKWHVLLHPDAGHVQVWQDDELVVDGRGPTLPFRDAVYDSLEVGISAHSFGDQAATLFVDDVRIKAESGSEHP
ncbi:MAG: hypothetical protein U0892_01415 [Pirellulales bacterium]